MNNTIEETRIEPSLRTRGAEAGSLGTVLYRTDAVRMAWESVIDRWLIEWGRSPGLVSQYGLVPATPDIVVLAVKVARACAEVGLAPPQRVLPDGEGGILFERGEGDVFEALSILADGRIELKSFKNSKLVSEGPLSLVESV